MDCGGCGNCVVKVIVCSVAGGRRCVEKWSYFCTNQSFWMGTCVSAYANVGVWVYVWVVWGGLTLSQYTTSEDDAEYSWIGWFCSRKGHEFLCEVCVCTRACSRVSLCYLCLKEGERQRESVCSLSLSLTPIHLLHLLLAG